MPQISGFNTAQAQLGCSKAQAIQRLTQLTYLCHTLERRAESPASSFPKYMTEDRILCLSQFGLKGGKSWEIYPTLSNSSGGWRKGLVKVQFQWRNLHSLCFLGTCIFPVGRLHTPGRPGLLVILPPETILWGLSLHLQTALCGQGQLSSEPQ